MTDTTPAGLEHLLQRSGLFADHLWALALRFGPRRADLRSRTAAAACELSLEHGQALQILLSHSTWNAACALLRVQYEALLRAAWILYAASDREAQRIASELTPDAQRAASAKLMLEELEAALGTQPGLAGLVMPLQQIRAVSWQAMNSFVHAGLHPLRRKEVGFPAQLADQVLRNSNGMIFLAVRLLYRLGEGPSIPPQQVERAYVGFEGCLPMSGQG